MTTYWAPLLHIYQPPTQDPKVLRIIDKECYKPLFSMLQDFDNVKFSLNINGILIELFYEFGLSDTMDLLKNLISETKIEIVGTAKFHPIRLMNGNKGVFGANIGHLWHEGAKVKAWMEAIMDGVKAGWVRPHVDKTFPLEQTPEAHAYIEQRKNIGKVILVP